MGDRKDSSSALPGIIAVVLVVVGVFVQQMPLERKRPAGNPNGAEVPIGLQTVPARLWQDPIDVAKKDLQGLLAQGDKGVALAQLKAARFDAALVQTMEGFCARLDRSSESLCWKPDLTVLGVVLFGGGYAESMESRRRTRYAVISGLAQANLRPHDAEHIDYVTIRDHPASEPMIVPYELFTAREADEPQFKDKTAARRMVLVLWLEDHAPKAPVASFDAVLTATRAGEHAGHRKLVLAAGTDSLQRVLRETRATTLPFDVLSAGSTVEESVLEDRLERDRREYPRRAYRTIGTDDRLARAMADEFALRRLSLGCRSGPLPAPFPKKTAHVLLVSDWDTTYSRALPATFARVLEERRACKGEEKWIHTLSYMRGLDGEIPEREAGDAKRGGAKGEGRKDGDASEALTLRLRTPYRERAEGDSQFDYLRRLTEHAGRINAQVAERKGEIMAVGVLGSDYYDKLAILQALRKTYPKAIFFTTDVDARLAQEDQYQWTRNVLVASHYGLELNRELQGDIPPFRDGYQTSTFLATQLAMQPQCQAVGFSHERLNGFLDEPRLFEVGRRGLVDLSPARRAGQPARQALCAAHPEDPNAYGAAFKTLHPEPARPSARHFVMVVGSLLLGVAALVLLVSSRLYAAAWRIGAERWIRAVSMTGVGLALLGAIIGAVGASRDEEPLLLIDGVSIWGTELLRLAALALTIAFLFRARDVLLESNAKLTRDFVPPDPQAQDAAAAAKDDLSIWDFLVPWNYTAFKWQEGQDFVSADRLWCNYLALSSPCRIGMRALAATIVFTLACMVLFSGDLPNRPVRGPISQTVDVALLFMAVLAYIYLAFFVADAVRLCKSFVRHLAVGKTVWPRPTVERFILGGETRQSRGRLPKSIQTFNYLRDYIDMRMIAERTEKISELIYYPFIVLLLIVCARSPIFDNWEWNPPLLISIGFTAALMLFSAYGLRVAAEEAREVAQRRLASELLRAKARDDKVAQDLLSTTLELVKNVSEGAYRPFTQQPIVRGLLIPFAGYGGLAIVEFLLIGKA